MYVQFQKSPLIMMEMYVEKKVNYMWNANS